jgi:hypothetical protein
MNGHFEFEQSAYPIGPLRVGEGFKVTDMRSLKCLHSQPIPSAEASRVAAEANAHIRAGTLTLKDNDTSVAEWVAAEVAKL